MFLVPNCAAESDKDERKGSLCGVYSHSKNSKPSGKQKKPGFFKRLFGGKSESSRKKPPANSTIEESNSVDALSGDHRASKKPLVVASPEVAASLTVSASSNGTEPVSANTTAQIHRTVTPAAPNVAPKPLIALRDSRTQSKSAHRSFASIHSDEPNCRLDLT